MKISDIGEFGFIDAIKADTLYHKENVVVGIGDDGAVYTTTPGWQQVAVIDTNAISEYPSKADVMLTNSSGIDVPIDTIVSPIIISGI